MNPITRMNEAQQLHAALGVHDPKVPKQVHLKGYATPERQMRKGEDGMRKAGGYGKSLRNWCNQQARKSRAARGYPLV